MPIGNINDPKLLAQYRAQGLRPDGTHGHASLVQDEWNQYDQQGQSGLTMQNKMPTGQQAMQKMAWQTGEDGKLYYSPNTGYSATATYDPKEGLGGPNAGNNVGAGNATDASAKAGGFGSAADQQRQWELNNMIINGQKAGTNVSGALAEESARNTLHDRMPGADPTSPMGQRAMSNIPGMRTPTNNVLPNSRMPAPSNAAPRPAGPAASGGRVGTQSISVGVPVTGRPTLPRNPNQPTRPKVPSTTGPGGRPGGTPPYTPVSPGPVNPAILEERRRQQAAGGAGGAPTGGNPTGGSPAGGSQPGGTPPIMRLPTPTSPSVPSAPTPVPQRETQIGQLPQGPRPTIGTTPGVDPELQRSQQREGEIGHEVVDPNETPAQQLERMSNDSQRANEQRYQELLRMTNSSGQQRTGDLNSVFNAMMGLSGSGVEAQLGREHTRAQDEMGATSQSLVGRGLNNTTIADALKRQTGDASAQREEEIYARGRGEQLGTLGQYAGMNQDLLQQLFGERAGIVERRSDTGPDLNAFALLSAAGATNGMNGGTGGGSPSGASTSLLSAGLNGTGAGTHGVGGTNTAAQVNYNLPPQGTVTMGPTGRPVSATDGMPASGATRGGMGGGGIYAALQSPPPPPPPQQAAPPTFTDAYDSWMYYNMPEEYKKRHPSGPAPTSLPTPNNGLDIANMGKDPVYNMPFALGDAGVASTGNNQYGGLGGNVFNNPFGNRQSVQPVNGWEYRTPINTETNSASNAATGMQTASAGGNTVGYSNLPATSGPTPTQNAGLTDLLKLLFGMA